MSCSEYCVCKPVRSWIIMQCPFTGTAAGEETVDEELYLVAVEAAMTGH